jgi:NTP pyrophosphatase (non-canonical NTP hydrolase)
MTTEETNYLGGVTFRKYQEAAHKTAVYPEGNGIIYNTLGLTSEVGEVVSLVSKWVRGDKDHIDLPTISKEIGDVHWFVSELSHVLGLSLEDIAQENIKKLKDRQARNVLKGDGDER